MLNRSARVGALIVLLATGLLISACHTMEGMGQDFSALGDKISGKAEQHTNQ
jgi:predicted small secreted protein